MQKNIYDGPIMTFLSKIGDLFILNILLLVFCLPLITIGAAITAGHFTALKIRRNEGHVFSCFWRSFKQNLKQSTCIWLAIVMYTLIVIVLYNTATKMGGTMESILSMIILTTFIFFVLICIWVIPLQARFVNSIKATFKNSFYMTFRYFWHTLLMAVFNVLPVGVLIVCALATKIFWFGAWLVLGVSGPMYLCVMMYDKIFERIEETVE